MDETKAIGLHAFFLAAVDEERKRREENQARIIVEQATAAHRAWAEIAPGWEPDHVEGRRVFIGGLVYRHLPAYQGFGKSSQFQLLGACPDCGQATWSRPCLTAAAIGEQLEAFRPEREHRCPARPGRIQEGDVVDVWFTDGEIGKRWVVLNRPGDTGEMWEFRESDGSVVAISPCAATFESVHLLSKKDKEES